MASAKHVEIVRRGAAAITVWREQPDAEYLNLIEANFTGSDLVGADLAEANLSRAILIRANLSEADLYGADLSEVNLSEADLSGADLTRANLGRAILTRANLTKALMNATIVGHVDLNTAEGLGDIIHNGPSTIGVDTLLRSVRRAGGKLTADLQSFFLGAGVPQELLKVVPKMVAEVKYHTCFLSYGHPDHEFAENLRTDLVACGVSCWLYAFDATPGKRTQGEIGQKRREADRMVVVCSSHSLIRDGILKEIEEQIDEYPDKIVPVSVDDLWKGHGFRVMRGDRDLKPYLLDKNYADFAKLPYDRALARLLKGLERERP